MSSAPDESPINASWRSAISCVCDRSGNFAITFALLAPVLVLSIGLGLDFLNGLAFKTRWDTAADAASLAAVQTALDYTKTNAALLSADQLSTNAVAAGQAAGLKAFAANAGPSQSLYQAAPAIDITASGLTFTATTTYTAKIGAAFGSLAGVNWLNLNGKAVATATGKTYINYYFIVDSSNSMGIGATSQDMAALFARTQALGYVENKQKGCVFGCHVPSMKSPGVPYQYSNEYVAHNLGSYITLRIDAAKSAMQSVVQAAAKATNSDGSIKFAIYTMQQDPFSGTLLNGIASLTSDYTKLKSAIDGISLGNNDGSVGYGDSNFSASLSQFQSVLKNAPSGNGSSPSAPLNYVFIITDGLSDTYSTSCPSTHCTSAFDAGICTSIKSNATVGVVYTTYLPIYRNNDQSQGLDNNYVNLVQPVQPQIEPNLRSCASSAKYYYEATDGPAILSAMNALFSSSSSPLLLTQ